jgi:UDP-N-acetylmuramate dehydrogenase
VLAAFRTEQERVLEVEPELNRLAGADESGLGWRGGPVVGPRRTMQQIDLEIRENTPLAPFTSLELGGAARYLVEAGSPAVLARAVRWARDRGLPVAVLGGGSNVVIADQGFDGLVVRVTLRGIETAQRSDGAHLTAAAGETWDEVVERAVDEDLTGIECLSGIPGTAGATPIQNVGAYGQEVADTISRVEVLDRKSCLQRTMAPRDCGFSYRWSRFRDEPSRFVVLAVTFLLHPRGTPAIRYPQLTEALSSLGAAPTLADVREAVLALRRDKSMVLAADDPNRRSVGSFFVNPVISSDDADRIRGQYPGQEVPCHPTSDGRFKIPAAWLIERSGFAKGFTRGAVGISSRHSLALVHYGGGSTTELIALARDIRRAVRDRFDVDLTPEPTFLGFENPDPTTCPAVP